MRFPLKTTKKKRIICFTLFSICFSGIFINIPKPPHFSPDFFSSKKKRKICKSRERTNSCFIHSTTTWRRSDGKALKLTGEILLRNPILIFQLIAGDDADLPSRIPSTWENFLKIIEKQIRLASRDASILRERSILSRVARTASNKLYNFASKHWWNFFMCRNKRKK